MEGKSLGDKLILRYKDWCNREGMEECSRRIWVAKLWLFWRGVPSAGMSDKLLATVGWYRLHREVIVTYDPKEFYQRWRRRFDFERKVLWSEEGLSDLNDSWDVTKPVLIGLGDSMVLYEPSIFIGV